MANVAREPRRRHRDAQKRSASIDAKRMLLLNQTSTSSKALHVALRRCGSAVAD